MLTSIPFCEPGVTSSTLILTNSILSLLFVLLGFGVVIICPNCHNWDIYLGKGKYFISQINRKSVAIVTDGRLGFLLFCPHRNHTETQGSS